MSPLLNFSRKRRLPIIHGTEAAECGLVCMAMISRYHGHDVDLNGMRQRFPISLSGATLRAVMLLADKMSFSSRALRLELDALPKLQTPAILHWDLNHYVVLKKATRRGIIIHDPAMGRREFTYEEASKHFTGVALELTPAKSFDKIEAKQTTRLSHLWSRLDGFWPALLQVVLLSTALQVVVFAAPFYLQLMVDEAIQTADSNLASVLALGFGALLVIRVAISALRSWALLSIGFLLSFQMVGNLVRHLLRLKTDYFEKRHVGDILSRIGSVEPIQDAMTQGLISSLIDGVMAIIAAVILFIYSPLLALVVIATLFLNLLFTFALFVGQRRRIEEEIIVSAKEQSHIMESVRGATTIKLMGREAEREASWRNLYAEVTNVGFSVGKYRIGMTAAGELITGLQTILVVYLASQIILSGDGFSVGMLFAFMSFRQTLTDRTLALIEQIIQFRLLSLHLDRIGDIIHATPDFSEGNVAPQHEGAGAISVKELSFRYGSADRWILENVSFDIEAGAFVAFVGPSGGGKTTLMKILLGLYQPVDGEVLLDGQSATPQLYRAWRTNVGVVSQDDQLLSGTIADNIAFFDPNLDMGLVEKAARIAQVHEDIARMPMQYLSLVGDMGSTLSGGQRQRVLLARALYRQPKLLFLDEGTANLDPDTEQEIVDLIDKLPITRIVVAHRPALVEKASHVFTVGDGNITQMVKEEEVPPDKEPKSRLDIWKLFKR